MSDEIPRRGLLNGFLARLPSLSYGEARLLDVCLTTIEMIRSGGDRQWQRRIATGPGDVLDGRAWHLASSWPAERSILARCHIGWGMDDPCETSPNPPLEERCLACWRAACGGSAIGMALLEIVGQIAIQDREREGLREAARDEMVPRRNADWLRDVKAQLDEVDEQLTATRRDHQRLPGDDMSDRVVVRVPCDPPGESEWEPEDHLTRLDSTPGVIALCEQARDRDEDLELEWDVSDIGAGEGR